ncbi:uncharacterized protein BO97DRAFT_425090 [Aspergillus homomorphus CBS 101889]|uniref:Amino acid permease/ SLC12A domain-containing protein n=1 Tax=Aspergillus homomorphus (strain CBS 101889) TaxID=1450537 RepID=A0A395HV42_ASPHC|nr:hypothetical protein BO97DRAFT_425090 [Aspergillus homomorphus CBS 101889]RAL11791.1 hypothetical protein BO97DRAFT_425090 [Aspergillus homomorphus CBS 101889]
MSRFDPFTLFALAAMSASEEKAPGPDSAIGNRPDADAAGPGSHTESLSATGIQDEMHRDLGNRKIQLVVIGTALFISIGTALQQAGPGGLLVAFVIHNVFPAVENNCMAEISTYMPGSGGFIRMTGNWVDDALGFTAVIVILFEITALNLVLWFWSDNIPPAAVCAACIVLYGCLNVVAVHVYGEAGFWLSSGKVILLLTLFVFTFVTMVGGSPAGDAYGFRHWETPFAESLTLGSVGRFQGFLARLWLAAFTCTGPKFIFMIAAEAKHERIYLKNAYKMVYWRFMIFFVGSALAVSIRIAYNDPTLVALNSTSSGTGASSPYSIAMKNMVVEVLPDLVATILNYIIICITYLCFFRASLPDRGWVQPYCGYIGLAWMSFVLLFYGYTCFEPWDPKLFLLRYVLPILMPVFYFAWKLFRNTRFRRPQEVDLRWEALEITAYEAVLVATEPPSSLWDECVRPFRRWWQQGKVV